MSDDPLDQINRFVIALTATMVIFVALLAMLLAWGAPDESIDRLVDFAGWLRDHNTQDGKVILSLAAAVVLLLMMIVIVVELTASPTQRMRVRNIKTGDATMSTPEIAERITASIEAMSEVSACETIVAVRGKRVEVVLDLHVGPGANLSRTADEACGRAHTLVEEQMGIALAAPPRARLHYRELRLTKEEATSVQPSLRIDTPGWEKPLNEGERDERRTPGAPEAP